MTQDKYTSGEYQRLVGAMVDREVLHNASLIVYRLMELEPDEMKWFELFRRAPDKDDCEGYGVRFLQHETKKTWRWGPIASVDWSDPFDDIEDAVADAACEIDVDGSEVYEHWIVSDFLARKLEARGEVIERDFYGLVIWGRCCTGQSILLDSVICDIYDALLAND